MSRFAWTFAWMLVWIATLAMFAVAPVAAQTAIPDVRGTWKGDSESIVLDGGNPHMPPTQSNEPHLRSAAFTLTIDKQDGRRFSGRIVVGARQRKSRRRVLAQRYDPAWPTTTATRWGRCSRRTGWSSAICMSSPTGWSASCLGLTDAAVVQSASG